MNNSPCLIHAERMPSESHLEMCTERIAVRRGPILLCFEHTLVGQCCLYWEIDSGYGEFALASIDVEVFKGAWDFLEAPCLMENDIATASVLIGYASAVSPAFAKVLDKIGA